VVEKDGLDGVHHFYITFRTQHPEVRIPSYLKEKYPQEMTIVLQYQFSNLIVREDYFGVSLSFNNILEDLHIPFAAVVGFADPSVKFGLQFHLPDDADDEIIIPILGDDSVEEEKITTKPAKKSKGDTNVVSLDKFRNKK
jgi:uncharacterized protein